MVQVRTVVLVLAVLAGSGCPRPDVVLRAGHHFSKTSSITIMCDCGDDPAIFKPEFEKELIRRGYNVISDSSSGVIEEERRTGEVAATGVVTATPGTAKMDVDAKGERLTQKQTSRQFNSDYSGSIRYLYDDRDHEVRRVNFTIVELRTGAIVASIGYEKSGRNVEIAEAISTQLDLALSGVKPAGFADFWGMSSKAK